MTADHDGGLSRAPAMVVSAISFLAVAACLVLLIVDQVARPVHPTPDITPRIALPVLGLAFAIVGGALSARKQSATIGWLFTVVGLGLALGALLFEYGTRAIYVTSGELPAGDVGIWVGDWLPFVMIPAIPILLLLFPTGRLLSARWRLPMTAAIVLVPLFLLQDMFSSTHLPQALRQGSAHALFASDALGAAASVLAAAALLSALASVVVRIRRAESVERHQLKWFAYAGGLVVASLVLSSFASSPGTPPLLGIIGAVAFIAGFAAVPVSVGIAILRYRLYDIDLVIRRTLVYTALAAFITAVYVGIVVGIGTLVGSGDRPNLVLSIVATAVVATAFQPVRERLQKIANRLVYGKRATPYEVLSRFSERVAESYAASEVLPRMARVLAEGTGAARAGVWVRKGSVLRQAASWPEGSEVPEELHVAGGPQAHLNGADRVVEVRHQGESLGALTVNKRPGESLTPVEEKLIEDLASQAGLVLKNVGLTAELLQRLSDLRASRQRLVAAQDGERRRLERNLHDGAQQNLVALKVKLGLAEALAERDPTKARELVSELKADADEALETLRDLARGIYPPLLADKGLAAALESQARKATIPVEVSADGIGRYPQDIEAAVYFCCLEALQNIQKYAGARKATVRLGKVGGSLRFEVDDDGMGFEPATTPRGSGLTNMADRLDALGGDLELESTPGRGTRLSGLLPVEMLLGAEA